MLVKIVLCPGVHPPEVTESFCREFTLLHRYLHLFIPTAIAPYNGPAIAQFINDHCSPQDSLLFIGFSAGAVGAVSAARAWSDQGNTVAGLWAWDGWGVPLTEDFPTVRISHDHFTHWSSRLLGRGDRQFYADPPVEHLDLWCNPQVIQGWEVLALGIKSRLSLLDFCEGAIAET